MGNIDTNTINSLLEKIASVKAELEAVENEIRNLVPAVSSQTEDIDISLGSDIDLAEGIDITIDEPVDLPSTEPAGEDMPEDLPADEPETPAFTAEPEPATEPEPVAEPEPMEAIEPEEVPVPVEVSETEYIPEPETIPESQPAAASETAVEPEPAPAPEAAPEAAPEQAIDDDLPFFDDAPALAPVAPAPEKKARKAVKAIVDSMTAETAVMDVMADRQAWRTDRAGTPVKNVISAISLNDRVFLINVLFNEDPMLFQDTITAFNAMGSFQEAIDYINEKFPSWDLNSEPVYRLMMAVRRKLG